MAGLKQINVLLSYFRQHNITQWHSAESDRASFADAFACNEMLLNFHGLSWSFFFTLSSFHYQTQKKAFHSISVAGGRIMTESNLLGAANWIYKLDDKPFAEFMKWKHKNWWSIVLLYSSYCRLCFIASATMVERVTAFIPLSSRFSLLPWRNLLFILFRLQFSTWEMYVHGFAIACFCFVFSCICFPLLFLLLLLFLIKSAFLVQKGNFYPASCAFCCACF